MTKLGTQLRLDVRGIYAVDTLIGVKILDRKNGETVPTRITHKLERKTALSRKRDGKAPSQDKQQSLCHSKGKDKIPISDSLKETNHLGVIKISRVIL